MMNWNLINKLRRIKRIGILKTLFINFSMLSFKDAIKFPIIVSSNIYFYDLSGKININSKVKRGMIRFGYFGEDTQVWKNNRTLLKIKGELNFNGNTAIGIGVSIRVEEGAILTLGNDCLISNNVKIICYENISIGNHSRIAWETQIIDTSFHFIKNKITKEIYPLNKPIVIGNNNWIGNRSSIMKGAETPDFCIIASGSLVNKKLDIPSYSVIAGTPAKKVRENVYRVLIKEELEIKKRLKNKGI